MILRHTEEDLTPHEHRKIAIFLLFVSHLITIINVYILAFLLLTELTHNSFFVTIVTITKLKE